MQNHLTGVQVGCTANYQHTCCLAFYCDGKFGIFGNHIRHHSQIYGPNGFAVVTPGLPYEGQQYDIQTNKDDFSFLGELRLGLAYLVRPHWRLSAGWRAVAITGVALPETQIPRNFADLPGVATVDSNGSLIVHGLQAGVEASF
jgi:hypothetical protein